MRSFWTMLLAVSFSFGVGAVSVFADSAPEKPKEEPKKEEPKADDSLALPWTADEIKKSVKVGMTMLFKVETTIGEKATTTYQKVEVTAVTEEGYTMKTTTMDADKKETGTAKDKTQKWTEYMSSMKFTKTDTTVSDETVEVTAGKFDCKVYTKLQKQRGAEVTIKFYFPKDKPGALVKMSADTTGYKMSQTLEEWKEGGETK